MFAVTSDQLELTNAAFCSPNPRQVLLQVITVLLLVTGGDPSSNDLHPLILVQLPGHQVLDIIGTLGPRGVAQVSNTSGKASRDI